MRNLATSETTGNGAVALSSSRTIIAGSNHALTSGSTKHKNSKWSQYMNLDKARNAIKIVGEPVDKVIEILKDVDPYTEASLHTVVKIRMDVFDELDEIVFSYLKDAYYEAFKQSYWWTKHFQYLCLTERKVVEEDFAIFRGMSHLRITYYRYFRLFLIIFDYF